MSTSFARPSGVRMMFEGLISRCTTSRSQACASAPAICSVMLSASPNAQRAVAVHQVAYIRAVDELEDDVRHAAVFAHVMRAGDVRMIQAGRPSGPRSETAAGSRCRRPAAATKPSPPRCDASSYPTRETPPPCHRRRRTSPAARDRAAGLPAPGQAAAGRASPSRRQLRAAVWSKRP